MKRKEPGSVTDYNAACKRLLAPRVSPSRDVRRAELVFKHYIVYDTEEKRRVHMAPIDGIVEEMGDVSFLGSLEETAGSLPAEPTVLNRPRPSE